MFALLKTHVLRQLNVVNAPGFFGERSLLGFLSLTTHFRNLHFVNSECLISETANFSHDPHSFRKHQLCCYCICCWKCDVSYNRFGLVLAFSPLDLLLEPPPPCFLLLVFLLLVFLLLVFLLLILCLPYFGHLFVNGIRSSCFRGNIGPAFCKGAHLLVLRNTVGGVFVLCWD